MKPLSVEDGMGDGQASEVNIRALTIPCGKCGVAANQACYWGDGLGSIPGASHMRRMVAAAKLPAAIPSATPAMKDEVESATIGDLGSDLDYQWPDPKPAPP